MSDTENAPLIVESIIKRKGGTFASTSDGTEYHFAPDAKDRHVAVISNRDHAQQFLRIAEGYRLAGVAQVKHTPAAAPLSAAVDPSVPVMTTAPSVDPSIEMDDANAPAVQPEPEGQSPAVETVKVSENTPIETLREVFEAETGRKANARAKAETLIAQIEAAREEKQGRA